MSLGTSCGLCSTGWEIEQKSFEEDDGASRDA
ncbi:hypothetical protein SCE1572_24735 [Sorangium cellulosum So0157-2]|uniref:Uncharacterized protein n=1 Tax=Sorangium cellulosum So0157-2 TaxID=1254432 RepID=S4XW13_SORCE|nr:hypothetical protein SCE1572_24735 [Sorangium cellulosum So0157-2]